MKNAVFLATLFAGILPLSLGCSSQPAAEPPAADAQPAEPEVTPPNISIPEESTLTPEPEPATPEPKSPEPVSPPPEDSTVDLRQEVEAAVAKATQLLEAKEYKTFVTTFLSAEDMKKVTEAEGMTVDEMAKAFGEGKAARLLEAMKRMKDMEPAITTHVKLRPGGPNGGLMKFALFDGKWQVVEENKIPEKSETNDTIDDIENVIPKAIELAEAGDHRKMLRLFAPPSITKTMTPEQMAELDKQANSEKSRKSQEKLLNELKSLKVEKPKYSATYYFDPENVYDVAVFKKIDGAWKLEN